MIHFVYFAVGFIVCYLLMYLSYNYLRGDAKGQDLKLFDHLLFIMISILSGGATFSISFNS